MGGPRSRPPGGGIPRRRNGGESQGPENPLAGLGGILEAAGNIEPIRERLAEVRVEITERLTAAGLIEDVRSVAIEVFDEGDEIVAVVELPGLTEADIYVRVEGRDLTIDGCHPNRRVSGHARLSADVADEYSKTLRNGLVEVRLRKRKEGTGNVIDDGHSEEGS
ncbi:MAG: Hsp20/alpha crystallin family protein [Candidatus Nanopelagicales bacterium]|nr:Hsp20/alpha crystallin family protein [Candidatus Nanopelagicales bacterium]MDZ4249144.1 Hsp20/alpha crystallin family protein [Candidatus Nanopelagicales bacterium]MDZ7578944.1 Hsp20/alpha crystallin family protein [Candidatus Nanopelagicales bacterium]